MEQTNTTNRTNQSYENPPVNSIITKPNNIHVYLLIVIYLLVLILIAIIFYQTNQKNKTKKNESVITKTVTISITPTINEIIDQEVINIGSTENLKENEYELNDARMFGNTIDILGDFESYYFFKKHLPWQKTPDSEKNILTTINDSSWIKALYSKVGETESFDINSPYKLRNITKEALTVKGEIYTVFYNGNNRFQMYICIDPKSERLTTYAIRGCLTNNDIKNTKICTVGNELVCTPTL